MKNPSNVLTFKLVMICVINFFFSLFSLFNDTTRLRLKNRPSLAANMFFNEAPSQSSQSSQTSQSTSLRPEMVYNDENGKSRRLPPRPKEPPPPPPPVAQVRVNWIYFLIQIGDCKLFWKFNDNCLNANHKNGLLNTPLTFFTLIGWK
jgi:hypothetical protein